MAYIDLQLNLPSPPHMSLYTLCPANQHPSPYASSYERTYFMDDP